MAHKCDGCRYKGQHSEMMFRPFGVCTKELNLVDAEKAYNAEVCPHKNHCVFCGEEIPADKVYCGICSAFANSLDPNQLKALETIMKNEEARAKFTASILNRCSINSIRFKFGIMSSCGNPCSKSRKPH